MSLHPIRLLTLLVCVGFAVGSDRPDAAQPVSDRSGETTEFTRLGLPLDFVENRGQWPTPAKFVASKGPVAAALEPHAIRLQLGREGTPMALVFEGASETVTAAGEQRRSGVYNFFVGNQPSAWRTGVPAYGAVVYRGMYDGVDVRVRDGVDSVEYDLLLAPAVDLRRVVIRADGATRIEIDGGGRLVLHTADGALTQTPPVLSLIHI